MLSVHDLRQRKKSTQLTLFFCHATYAKKKVHVLYAKKTKKKYANLRFFPHSTYAFLPPSPSQRAVCRNGEHSTLTHQTALFLLQASPKAAMCTTQ